jgi:uncharacterized protein YbjT (DUF2867 family)
MRAHLLLLLLLAPSAQAFMTMSGKVFVAGATGRLGSRVAKQVLSQGLQVVAGVRSLDKAKELLPPEVQPIVYDLADEKALQQALAGCDTVVCALGASESDFLNVRAPYLVDGVYTSNLIRAAKSTPSVKVRGCTSANKLRV